MGRGAEWVSEAVGGRLAAGEEEARGGMDTEKEPTCVALGAPGRVGEVEGPPVLEGVKRRGVAVGLGLPAAPGADCEAAPSPAVGVGAAAVAVGAAAVPVRENVASPLLGDGVEVGAAGVAEACTGVGVGVSEAAAGEGVALLEPQALALPPRPREGEEEAVAGKRVGVAAAAGERVARWQGVAAAEGSAVPEGCSAVGLAEGVAAPMPLLPVGERVPRGVAEFCKDRAALRVPPAREAEGGRVACALPVGSAAEPVGRRGDGVALPVASREVRALPVGMAVGEGRLEPPEETLARLLTLRSEDDVAL